MENSNKTQVQGGSGNSFVYRDWSREPQCESDLDAIQRENELHPDGRRFPVKLNAILSNGAFCDIIDWAPHGRSWRILNRERLITEVLPLFFENARINSFIRLVNAWGFRRITTGVEKNSYFHELFLQGMPHLHIRMKRLLLNEKKIPINSHRDLPNFYDMPLLASNGERLSTSSSAYAPPIHDSKNIESANNNPFPASRNETNQGDEGGKKDDREKRASTTTENSIQNQSISQRVDRKLAPNNSKTGSPLIQSQTASAKQRNQNDTNAATSLTHALQRLRQAQNERIRCLQLQLSEAQQRGNDIERLQKAAESGPLTSALLNEIQSMLNQGGFFDDTNTATQIQPTLLPPSNNNTPPATWRIAAAQNNASLTPIVPFFPMLGEGQSQWEAMREFLLNCNGRRESSNATISSTTPPESKPAAGPG